MQSPHVHTQHPMTTSFYGAYPQPYPFPMPASAMHGGNPQSPPTTRHNGNMIFVNAAGYPMTMGTHPASPRTMPTMAPYPFGYMPQMPQVSSGHSSAQHAMAPVVPVSPVKTEQSRTDDAAADTDSDGSQYQP